jgi:hypothetical protein
MIPLKAANESSCLGVGLIRNRAGVYNEDISVGSVPRGESAACLGLLPHALSVVLIGFATEGVVVDTHVNSPSRSPYVLRLEA